MTSSGAHIKLDVRSIQDVSGPQCAHAKLDVRGQGNMPEYPFST